jgi:uncharacterized protein (DUF111 family)
VSGVRVRVKVRIRVRVSKVRVEYDDCVVCMQVGGSPADDVTDVQAREV